MTRIERRGPTAWPSKRHDPTLAAVFAPYPQEPISENAALQVGSQLLLHVFGQLAVGGAQALKEGLEVTGHQLIQGLGYAAAVGDGGHAAPVRKSWARMVHLREPVGQLPGRWVDLDTVLSCATDTETGETQPGMPQARRQKSKDWHLAG